MASGSAWPKRSAPASPPRITGRRMGSPAHADAEGAMRDAGIRGRFAYGPALGIPNNKPMDLADWARLRRDIGKNE